MLDIAQIVLPVFALVALGYLTAWTGYLPQEAGDGLAEFVVRIAVPILLVRSIATAEFGYVNPWGFLAVYGIAVVLAWALAALAIILWFKRGYRAAAIAGVSASFSNLVLLGIPLIERAYGAAGLQVLFFLISFHLPFMMTLSTFLMEHGTRADGVDPTPMAFAPIAKSLLRNLAVNPIIIGIIVGSLWRLSGFGVSGMAVDVLDLLARTTGPLALFSLGMGLIKYGIKGNLPPAIVLSILSLVVMPGTVFVLGTTVFELPPLWLKVALLAASCPTGMNAYLIATYFRIGQGLATNSIVLSMLGSVVSIPFWLSMAS